MTTKTQQYEEKIQNLNQNLDSMNEENEMNMNELMNKDTEIDQLTTQLKRKEYLHLKHLE